MAISAKASVTLLEAVRMNALHSFGFDVGFSIRSSVQSFTFALAPVPGPRGHQP